MSELVSGTERKIGEIDTLWANIAQELGIPNDPPKLHTDSKIETNTVISATTALLAAIRNINKE